MYVRIACSPEVGRKVMLAEETIASALEVGLEDLRAPTRRTPKAALARQIAMYLTHTALGVPLSEVARAFRRDRSTAKHAVARIEDRREDPYFDHWLCELEIVLAQRPLAGGFNGG